MQCGVREVRRQEVVREEVKCFGCGEKGHKKWECPNMRKRKQEKCNDKSSRGDNLITLNVMRERRELDEVSW